MFKVYTPLQFSVLSFFLLGMALPRLSNGKIDKTHTQAEAFPRGIP